MGNNNLFYLSLQFANNKTIYWLGKMTKKHFNMFADQGWQQRPSTTKVQWVFVLGFREQLIKKNPHSFFLL